MSRERIRQIGCDGLARIRGRVGPTSARANPARRLLAEQLEALVSRIENASASSDPDAVTELMKDLQITIGSSRAGAHCTVAPSAPISFPIRKFALALAQPQDAAD